MTSVFCIARTGDAAETAFCQLKPTLEHLLPHGAIVEHVGATAVPDCLTKGDLDVCIVVPALLFDRADTALAAHFDRNTGSPHTTSFASFCDGNRSPPLGIQLVVGGSEFDTFIRFRDLLRADRSVMAAYNTLKTAWDGKDMDAYRTAKAAFIERVLVPKR